MPWVLIQGKKVWEEDPTIEPKISASIWETRDGQWAIGNLMLCEKIPEGTKAPADSLVTWKDGLDVEYCLRPQAPRLPEPEGAPSDRPFKAFMTRWITSALFEIGCDVLVKVTHAPTGYRRSEGTSMRLIKERAPSVPVAEAIHYWVDEKWARYFVIQRRVHGPTLDNVWFQLEEEEKWEVTMDLARHIKAVSDITSPLLQASDGGPLVDENIICHIPLNQNCEPYPKPFPGPFTAEEFLDHWRNAAGVEPPEMVSEFHFHHNDLSPENVIVTGLEKAEGEEKRKVRIAAIIDWEDAGFYPRFFIPFWVTNPLVPRFRLSVTMQQDMALSAEFQHTLHDTLREVGFPSGWDFHPWWTAFYKGMGVGITNMWRERNNLPPIPTPPPPTIVYS